MVMGKELKAIDRVDLEDDLGYLSTIPCRGFTKRDAISVERYAEERDLHRAILASHLQSTPGIVDLTADDTDDGEDLQVLRHGSRKRRRPDPRFPASAWESGEPSAAALSCFLCEICAESKPQTESFRLSHCDHSYCSDCVSRYVASKLLENSVRIHCPSPGCGGAVDPDLCTAILPPEVLNRWRSALCEAAIPFSQRLYCPYKDCSALFIDDGDGGAPVVTWFECAVCRRHFCARCRVPWHSGFSCEEFNALEEHEREREDLMVMELARIEKWRRCPRCRFFVEKTYGCIHMNCRCGVQFCYACGRVSCSCSG